MGFSLGRKTGPISEINVTPLVDVMLVLLIIFMVTAPLMFSGINLKLPKTKKITNLSLTSQQVILSFTQAGNLYIGKDRILVNEMIDIITKKFKENNTQVLFLRAHESIKYGKVAKLMSLLKRGGISNIALVTEIEK